MKKSVKILIVILCLIIVGLVTFIVVDKVMNKDSNANENNTGIVGSNTSDSVNNNVKNSTNETEIAEENRTTSSTSNNSEIEIANDAIRKALKDEKWVTGNLFGGAYISYEDWRKEQSGFDSEETAKQIYKNFCDSERNFAKITSINGMPAYLVDMVATGANSHKLNLVTYKNGKVVTSKNPIVTEYANVRADLNNNLIITMGDVEGVSEIYKIENNEFKGILYIEVEVGTDRYTHDKYFYNGTECTENEYKSYCDEFQTKYDFKEIKTELTNENIDKYVK